jgi:hypothetical protein
MPVGADRGGEAVKDRDVYVEKHTPPAGVPAFVCDDPTGVYSNDPEKLRAARSRRTTAERLAHLEDKYDRLVRQVLSSRTKIIVALCTAAGAIAGYLMGGCVA